MSAQLSQAEKKISEVTRRNLFDELRLGKINWSGRLGESDFLSRIFDLSMLPSNDYRFPDMAGDLAMHRENFDDWPDDWIYDDTRLNLLRCPDDVLLTFLCEMIHPVVRSDNPEVQKLLTIFNKHLAADGFHIAERTRISGKPVFAGGVSLHVPIPETKTARKLADALASEHVLAQITRMESSIYADPALAIGTAKEFVESMCKGILDEYNIALSGGEDIPKLVFLTREQLGLNIGKKTDETIRKTLGALATLTQGIAELRGQLGTGHGQHPTVSQPRAEIARLAVSTATALGIFLFDMHRNQTSTNTPSSSVSELGAPKRDLDDDFPF